MSIKLRDLIRNVRACKTAAEERAVISKECALIRTSFKEEDSTFRHRNVAKLLFVHMLGYPSHFGQLECLKLVASPRFLDKRVGYLGLSILVQDSPDVLLLVTNSLSSDLSHRNPYVQGLALSALGNLSNPEMLRDLSGQVLKLLSNTNANVRKKAALCAIQIFRKVPDMVEDFVPVVISMLQDRNHAVLLTAATALLEVGREHPSFVRKARKAVPQLVKVLKNLVLSGYAPEYDVNGITDPFLHVQILRALGALGKNHAGAAEAMNDILAQVATNTEGNRNSGNAILYECVRTIFSIDCEDALRVLAINILGRFLQNRDNNIRYVALTMLGKVVSVDKDAVQRHRDTIVECLRDVDVSIRVRAVDLVFALISQGSIEALSKEILNFLVVAPPEQKKDLCSRLLDAAINFSPSKQWHIHTLISMMCIAGRNVTADTWQMATALIGQPEAEEFRPQVVHRLFAALNEDATQTGLVYTAVWAIGEFGPLLLQPAEKFEGDGYYDALSETEVLELLEKTRRRHDSTITARSMIMNAYAKLYVRFSESQAHISELLHAYQSSMNLELQARSCELSALVASQIDDSWLAQMPVPTDEEMALRRVTASQNLDEESSLGGGSDSEESSSEDSDASSDDEAAKKAARRKAKAAKKAGGSGAGGSSNELLQFDDIFGGGSGSGNGGAPAAAAGATGAGTGAGSGNQMDLLADIFGGGGAAPSVPAPAPSAPMPSSGGDDLLGMLGGGPASQPVGESFPTLNAFEKNGIKVTMNFARGAGDKQVVVTATYSNSNGAPVSNFLFQAAVPKFISLKMEPPTGNALAPFGGGQQQQRINLVNTMQGTKPIVMKVKISYSMGGQDLVEQATVQGFPMGL